MPTIPEPRGAAPDLMPFLHWVRGTLKDMIDAEARRNLTDSNQNSSQNSTMSTLVDRLGTVEDIMDTITSTLTIDASQVTSGTLATARVPVQDASKISGGALSITSATIGGALGVGGNVNVTGHVYVPNSTTASFGSWTVAYIDGDGRLTRGASSARFKTAIIPADLDCDLFSAELKEYEMLNGDGWRMLGYIAEDLVGTPMERFVVWEREVDEEGEWHFAQDESGDKVPLSIDFITMLMAQTAQLKRDLTRAQEDQAATNDRLELIEARLAALEGTSH